MIPLSLFESNVEQGITLAERPPEESTVSKADTILFLKSYKKSKREADFLKDKLKDLEAALVLPKGLSITEIGHIDGGRFLLPEKVTPPILISNRSISPRLRMRRISVNKSLTPLTYFRMKSIYTFSENTTARIQT